MASAESQDSSFLTSPFTYDVLLSFKGEDTRKNFSDHLYTALVQAGFHTFRDDDEIQRGENIDLEIQKAIQESKISIIVFSKHYASSRWCLDELVMIIERKKLVGLHVLPVFYDVDPSQVRNQTGSFAEAFVGHEERFKEKKGKVEGWKAALREVADLKGMVLGDGYQSQFVQNIVKEAGNKVSHKVLNVDSILVGIEYPLEVINSWLNNGSDDVSIAIIYGIGGIGKTTIAKIVYNMNFSKFEASSFLANVREMSEQPNGLVQLQRKLLSDVLKRKTEKIYSIDEGIPKIKNVICRKKVLIVLDDVDQSDQFDEIIGEKWFYPGSKIIVTTRHEHLLPHEVNLMFKMKELDDNKSLQLFSCHAFRQDHPTHGFEKHSENVVRHCGGLPLALRIFGRSLFGRTTDKWESALQKLEKIANGEIQKVLRISYDSLEDDHDKSLFLDIACFFTGMDIGYVVRILDGCNFCATSGIQNLVDRCLITITIGNKLMMHQLVRDMGREIVRQESHANPRMPSRLWDNKDAFAVLNKNAGTESIRGLSLNLSMSMEDVTNKSMLPHQARQLSCFSWIPVNNAQEDSLSTEAFSKMHNLKFLNLNCVQLKGSYKDFPKSLVWLRWHGFSLNSVPNDLCLENLVVLDMCYSNLKNVWKGKKFLGKLKILDLSHSHNLVETPNFEGLPCLERLVLKDCTKLVEVDESIGRVQRLVSLNLKDCRSLKKLPVEIHMLTSLEELIASGCSSIGELPEDLRKLESLKVLHADGIAMNQVVPSKGIRQVNLSLLHSTVSSWLLPKRCAQSTSLLLAFFPSSLVSLCLADCGLSDNVIPKLLNCLPSLEVLNIGGNPICCIPESIKNLTKLNLLLLMGCTRLQSIPELPPSVSILDVTYCKSLERFGVQSERTFAFISGCEKLVKAPCSFNSFELEPVRDANKEILNNLGLVNVESLDSIEVELYNDLAGVKLKTTIQLLYDGGIFSVFVPRSQVPDCFSSQEKGPSISFDVLPIVGHKVSGLSLSVIYRGQLRFLHDTFVFIKNKTKGVKWRYCPTIYGIPKSNEDMLWLSYWMFGDQLEDKDHVKISVLSSHNFEVKGCGIRLIDEQEGSGTDQSHIRKIVPSWDHRLLDKGSSYILDHYKYN